MQETNLERIIRVIAAAQHYSAEQTAAIGMDTTFEQLSIDSLDGINIVFALENEFDVNIPDDAAKSIRGVRDIAEGIDALLLAKQPAEG